MLAKPDDTPLSSPAISRWLVALPYAVLIVGMLVTGYIWHSSKRIEHQRQYDSFSYEVKKLHTGISHDFFTYNQILLGAQGLMAVAPSVQRADFSKFVAAHRLKETYPGIQGVGYSQVIPRDQISQHIQMIRKQGFPDYAIVPAGIRDPYSSIIYIEPFNNRNQRVFGYDMYSERTRRQAMQLACDRNEAVLSGRVTLLQETDDHPQSGFLLYMPVFRKSADVSTIQSRRRALVGWVYEPFRMDDFMNGLHTKFPRELRVRIYDGKTTNQSQLMYDSFSNPSTPGRFENTSTVTYFNQSWTIEVDSLPEYGQLEGRHDIQLSLLIGLAFTFILAHICRSLIIAKRKLTIEVRHRTQELEVEKSELKRSEEHLSMAIEGSGIGLWDWHLKTGELYVDERWAALIGYKLEELQPVNIHTWWQYAHPDDLERSEAALQDYLAGRTPGYSCEVRMRHKDGRWIWLLDTGRVSMYGDDGTPVRMTGTHFNINDSKKHRSLLEGQEAMLMGISSALNELLTGQDFDSSVNAALATIGNGLNLEDVYVFRNHTGTNGELFGSLRNEWCVNASRGYINNSAFQSIPYSLFPRWLSELGSNRPISGPVWTFPEYEREFFESHSMRSLIVVPIFKDDEFWGFVGFNDIHIERIWTVSEMSILTLLAKGIGGAVRQHDLMLSLEDSRQWLQTVFQNIATGTIIIDSETQRIQNANPAFLDAVELAEDQVVGSQYTRCLRSLHGADSRCLGTTEAHIHEECELIKSDGTRLPVIISTANIVSAGHLYTIVSVVVISLLKESEEKLRQSSVLYHGIINAMTDSVYCKDLDGHYIEYNNMFSVFFGAAGKKPKDGIGLTLFDLLPDAEAQIVTDQDQLVYATSTPVFFEYDLTSVHGITTTFDHHKSPLFNSAGECIGLVGVARDISERKRAERVLAETMRKLEESYSNLHELERMRDNLVQFIAQDMRSSVTSILAGLDIAKDAKLSERFIAMAKASAYELEYMVSSLLEVNAMENQNAVLLIAQEDLLFVAHRASDSVGIIAAQQNVVVTVSGVELTLNMDFEMIRRVIVNLIINAIKHSAVRGSIEIEVSKLKEMARVTVTDHGPEIPEVYREAIFDKFRQREIVVDGTQYSSGLGLSFCKLAVELHGGRIGVDSSAGTGNIFLFELPT